MIIRGILFLTGVVVLYAIVPSPAPDWLLYAAHALAWAFIGGILGITGYLLFKQHKP